MDGFKTWLSANGHDFPVPEADFIERLKEFVSSTDSAPYITRSLIGLIGDDLKYVTVRATATAEAEQPYEI